MDIEQAGLQCPWQWLRLVAKRPVGKLVDDAHEW